MRGESRRCKGSMEPLRRLPDGALATRRIVSWRYGAAAQSCGPCAARAVARVGARLKKTCRQALTCKLSRRLAGGRLEPSRDIARS